MKTVYQRAYYSSLNDKNLMSTLKPFVDCALSNAFLDAWVDAFVSIGAWPAHDEAADALHALSEYPHPEALETLWRLGGLDMLLFAALFWGLFQDRERARREIDRVIYAVGVGQRGRAIEYNDRELSNPGLASEALRRMGIPL